MKKELRKVLSIKAEVQGHHSTRVNLSYYVQALQSRLAPIESDGEATLQVLRHRIDRRLRTGELYVRSSDVMAIRGLELLFFENGEPWGRPGRLSFRTRADFEAAFSILDPERYRVWQEKVTNKEKAGNGNGSLYTPNKSLKSVVALSRQVEDQTYKGRKTAWQIHGAIRKATYCSFREDRLAIAFSLLHDYRENAKLPLSWMDKNIGITAFRGELTNVDRLILFDTLVDLGLVSLAAPAGTTIAKLIEEGYEPVNEGNDNEVLFIPTDYCLDCAEEFIDIVAEKKLHERLLQIEEKKKEVSRSDKRLEELRAQTAEEEKKNLRLLEEQEDLESMADIV